MKTKTKTTEELKKTAKSESYLGFKRGCSEILFEKKQANINKGKGNKLQKRQEETLIFQKGVDRQKPKKKYGILKGSTKGNQGNKTE